MSTFNVILGYQGLLFRDFFWFFFQSDRPTQNQEMHSTLNEKEGGDGPKLSKFIVKTMSHCSLHRWLEHAQIRWVLGFMEPRNSRHLTSLHPPWRNCSVKIQWHKLFNKSLDYKKRNDSASHWLPDTVIRGLNGVVHVAGRSLMAFYTRNFSSSHKEMKTCK